MGNLRVIGTLSDEDAFRCASFGIEPEEQSLPVTVDQYAPWNLHFYIDGDNWLLHGPERLRADFCDCPAGHGNPCELWSWECKARARQNGNLTVRQWFRTMRASDFARDVERTVSGTFFIAIDRKPWTLFDTQQVIHRETRDHYPDPDVECLSLDAWIDICDREGLLVDACRVIERHIATVYRGGVSDGI